ncbi:MAG: helix-turn-helix transcriptional regulator, partial [Collinsella aerofaciens]|nr:helix-turn-helix transcriptional regulator [Collinsella aerofaciens]
GGGRLGAESGTSALANPAYPRWRDWRKCVGGNGENYIDANRRTSEGKSRREAVRCLKRYIAREVYHVLMDPNPDGAAPEGPELAKMRKAMRVTQKKAAAELGLSAATLGHLERGKRRSTKLERRYYELLCELERTLPQTAS